MMLWLLRSPRRIIVILAVLLFAQAVALAGAYLFMSSTTAYKQAAAFVTSSHAVRTRAGKVTSVWLDPSAYKIAWWGNDGYAIYSMWIVAQGGRQRIRVISIKSSGRWALASASMNNQALETPPTGQPAPACTPPDALVMQAGGRIDPPLPIAASITPCARWR